MQGGRARPSDRQRRLRRGSGGDGAVRRHAQLGTGMDLADAGPSHDALAAAALAPRESIDVDVAAAGAGRSPPGDAERIADGLLG
jgi:hypothetical protein